MKAFRTIYEIDAITNDGHLLVRRFARNKKVAEKIAHCCKDGEVSTRKLQKCEHVWVNSDDVEG